MHYSHRTLSQLRETRQLSKKTGNSNVLVVRVSAGGGAETPTSTLEAIEDVIFTRSPSVQSQFAQCSSGIFTISKGAAVDITLDYTVQGRTIDDDDVMKADMARLAGEQVGTALPGDFDNVIYCLPLGTTNFGDADWVAFATYNGYESFYNDGRCEDVLTVMHEMGHNSKFFTQFHS